MIFTIIGDLFSSLPTESIAHTIRILLADARKDGDLPQLSLFSSYFNWAHLVPSSVRSSGMRNEKLENKDSEG
jgi:hypothetical protein